YARLCQASFHQTLKFCPECVEPQTEAMAFLFSRPETLVGSWKHAWEGAGITYRELPLDRVFASLPGLDRRRIQHAFELPARAIRLDSLLEHLAAPPRNAGAEIRTAPPVRSLRRVGDRIAAIVTGTGEEIAVQFAVLAGGASGFPLSGQFFEPHAGS